MKTAEALAGRTESLVRKAGPGTVLCRERSGRRPREGTAPMAASVAGAAAGGLLTPGRFAPSVGGIEPCGCGVCGRRGTGRGKAGGQPRA